jgi:hypothetical protein
VDLDTVQHLVSAAAGESFSGPAASAGMPGARLRRPLRDRLSRLVDHLSAPPPSRW